MIAMRMTWICHASTGALRATAFPQDEPLDEQGVRKARALTRLMGRPNRVWTSPAARARQTVEALGLLAEVDPALRDCDYGRWAGRPIDAIHEEEPDALANWMRDPGAALHGGESVLDLLRRIGTWLDNRSQDAGHTIVVTHAAVIRAAIIHAIHATPRSFWRIDIAPLSRTLLSRSNDQWRLRGLEPLD
jgi:broad specificity phosphatase PhoE